MKEYKKNAIAIFNYPAHIVGLLDNKYNKILCTDLIQWARDKDNYLLDAKKVSYYDLILDKKIEKNYYFNEKYGFFKVTKDSDQLPLDKYSGNYVLDCYEIIEIIQKYIENIDFTKINSKENIIVVDNNFIKSKVLLLELLKRIKTNIILVLLDFSYVFDDDIPKIDYDFDNIKFNNNIKLIYLNIHNILINENIKNISGFDFMTNIINPFCINLINNLDKIDLKENIEINSEKDLFNLFKKKM